MRNRHVRRLAPLAVTVTLLMASPASAQSWVGVGPAAELVAGGAEVDIPLSVACDPAGPGEVRSVSVEVRQAGGDVVASGNAYEDDPPCDGELRDMTVPVLADPGSRPFRAGDAAVHASLTQCSFAPGAVGDSAPNPTQVTPPEPSPSQEPPGGGVTPCETFRMSAVVFVHPMEPGGHPEPS
jgi:hypothetical protein